MEGYLTHRNDYNCFYCNSVTLIVAFLRYQTSALLPLTFKKIKGCGEVMNFGQILTAMVTPFDANGEIDYNVEEI